MIENFKVFTKNSYSFEQFILDDKVIENAYEVTLTEYGSKENLSCGLFKMTKNFFELTYPNDEVLIVLKGEVIIQKDTEKIELSEGDIFTVKRGLKVIISTNSYVEMFFASYPVET